MKAHKASLTNSLVLIIFGTWGYLDSEGAAITALIPVIFGVLILIMKNTTC